MLYQQCLTLKVASSLLTGGGGGGAGGEVGSRLANPPGICFVGGGLEG
jgi:hypothetical protein